MKETNLGCLDYIATAIFTLDVSDEGEPIYSAFNAFAQNAAGLQLTNIIGNTAKDIYPGRGGHAAYARHLEVIASCQSSEYEIRLPLRGKDRVVRTTLNPVLDPDGKVIQIFGTSIDITDVEVGREVQATVQTITHEMEDFITMAAHDLRTPMRNVQHIADMLRDDFMDMGDGKLDLIDLLEDVAVKATSLISDVLAHAQATKAKEEILSFDFGSLSRELCSILDPMAKHSFTVDECMIVGDKTAYQIVLRNLLDNAFKHGGKEHLTMSIEVRQAENQMIEVNVRDDGHGFENPGVAFLGTGKLRTDSGFGLLGIRRLVQSRGGDIFAKAPDVGVGSVVSFTLPGVMAAEDDAMPARSMRA